MTTRRPTTRATASDGVNFVRTIVEHHNSIFHAVDSVDDLGNDAHVEFIVGEEATGCCVAVQIKAGPSYRTPAGDYVIPADRDHFEYWKSHVLPVIGIVYDPERRLAFWVDITSLLTSDPRRLVEGPFRIQVSQSQRFADATFDDFRQYCLHYRAQYSSDVEMGRALIAFAETHDEQRCMDGIRALFAFHRQRVTAWYYLIACFAGFRGSALLRPMVYVLVHVPGHGDVGWGPGNRIDEGTRAVALQLMKRRFGWAEVVALLESVDDRGFERRTIGQSAHAIIEIVEGRDTLLHQIAFDDSVSDSTRASAFLLWASYRQGLERGRVLREAARYSRRFPETPSRWMFQQLSDTIREHGHFGMY